MKDKILSVQSKLVYGYVGGNIAELVIQLHGLDPISFPTVYLAAHVGHQPTFGTVVDQTLFEDYIQGVRNLNIVPDISYMISGFIGSGKIVESVASFIEEIKRQYPDKPYICDPVLGDVDTGQYVPDEVALPMVERLVTMADVITPNHFEIEYILGKEITTERQMIEEVNKRADLRNKTIIVTSCLLEDSVDVDELEILVLQNGEAQRVMCNTIEIETTGTGDFFTSMLASQLANGAEMVTAVERAACAISKALQFAVDAGESEMNSASLLHALGIERVK